MNAAVHAFNPRPDPEAGAHDSKPLSAVTPTPRPSEPAAPASTAVSPNLVDRGDAFLGPARKGIKIDEVEDCIHTLIAEGDVFDGNLTVAKGVRISGTVNGNVTSQAGSVVVDTSGKVDGNVVSARRIICAGLIGNLDATRSSNNTVVCEGVVAMMDGGRIVADVFYGRLVTLDDSFVDGQVRPFSQFKAK
jgi:cytoskeletal protein CcmA (bactofilin family)